MDKIVIKKKTVVYEVVDNLLALIQSGAFKQGERLPSERRMCESFQVSRSSLRAAIQQLEFNGILEARQGSGTYVSKNAANLIGQTSGKLTDIICDTGNGKESFIPRMECRVIMEPAAARLAALYANDEDIRELREIIERMEEYVASSQRGGFYAEDQNFHDRIARASGNPFIRDIVNNYCVSIYYHLHSFGQIPNLEENSLRQHKQILQAIEEKNPRKAEREAYEHVLYSFEENARYVYGVEPVLREGVVDLRDNSEDA